MRALVLSLYPPSRGVLGVPPKLTTITLGNISVSTLAPLKPAGTSPGGRYRLNPNALVLKLVLYYMLDAFCPWSTPKSSATLIRREIDLAASTLELFMFQCLSYQQLHRKQDTAPRIAHSVTVSPSIHLIKSDSLAPM